ncbi:cupredoxin domain-containing protein [Solirubrobacter soli]|uniref:cupredoxin domain-containing protein n=1 Tax=Solirubrobacter soli TaxID=363832 RepID=UPI00069EB648|nr:plastocyanin/azurin family copper-binding protein [Solirubrobacter soli]
MRRSLPLMLAFLVLFAAPASASEMDHGPAVPIYNAAFGIPHVDVLAGDTVTWHNDSLRTHNVNADDGSFASPRLLMSASYQLRFDTPGDFAYFCQLHPSMRGDVAVHRVLLDAAKEPAAPGKPYALTGRAALPEGATVSIQAGGVETSTAKVGAGGAFTATVTPRETTAYTAVVDGESAPPVQVLVLDRKVSATQKVRGKQLQIDATVTPASKGATVVLQLKLKEHFGWWPVKVAELDASSKVRFTLKRGRKVQARVLLTASDAATELARSATFRLR